MAEAILTGITGEILIRLTSAAFEEIGRWLGVKDELNKLKDTVSTIQAVLLDAEAQSNESNQVKELVGQLKQALYDADDLLDDFSTESLQRRVVSGNKIVKEVRLFFSSSNHFTYRAKICRKIRSIRNKLEMIRTNKLFHLTERRVESLDHLIRKRSETHSSIPQIFIGRESDKREIKELLLSSHNYEENVVVIPIVGIGGLGKTALAQSVYNDREVGMHFELKLWVCITDDFDVKIVVKMILESVTRAEPKFMAMDALKNDLHELINRKKYLLVLDDVWNENVQNWHDLMDLLVCGARGSRIIVTTRLEPVASLTSSIPPYKLKGLPKDEAWLLFRKIAFEGGKEPENAMQRVIGKEILAKCLGVPLAIRTIGGLLYFKKTVGEWESFKSKDLSQIDQQQNHIFSTLMLSYIHLPSHLKHCFAYCSLFPKDTEIKVTQLIDMWIAQGFIVSTDPNDSIEDIGYEYLKDLVWRSFFHEVEEDDLGNMLSCKMHDLMHDLARLVAGREISICNSNTMDIDGKTRHISCKFNLESEWEVSPSLLNASKVRTLYLQHGYRRHQIKNGQCQLLFSKLRYLRMIDLHYLEIEMVPPSISKLKHLRYLNLSRNKMELLPDSITKLQNLQVLDLRYCNKLRELPKDMKRMVNLRCLDIFGCSLTHMPRGLGQLTSLQRLPMFIVSKNDSKHSGGLVELSGFNNLRGALFIEGLRNAKNSVSDCRAANLKGKPYLQSLWLLWDETENGSNNAEEERRYLQSLAALQPHHNLKKLGVRGYGGVKFPSWFSSLTNLKRLDIWWCKKCRSLPPLHQFHSLLELTIGEMTELEYIDSNQDSKTGSLLNIIPRLKILYLRDCPNLKGWWNLEHVRTALMPSTSSSSAAIELPEFDHLSYLSIGLCPNLVSLPPFPSLQTLLFRQMDENSLEQMVERTLEIGVLDYNSEQIVSSLKVLEILDCPEIMRLPRVMMYLTSLQTLQIRNCEELDLCEDDNTPWQCLTSLEHLELENIPKMVSLPNGLRHITTLQSLKMRNCDILTSLPGWMPNLTSLHTLWISRCAQLEQKCGSNRAEDWHLISHISNIEINWKSIQQNGCYKL